MKSMEIENLEAWSYCLIPSEDLISKAIHLIKMERVTVSQVCENGVVFGSVLCPETFKEVNASVLIKSNNEFYIENGSNVLELFSLAIVLKLVKINSSKKSKKIYKKLTSNAPDWIKDRPTFSLDFTAAGKDFEDIVFENLQKLETFWAMQDMATNLEKKNNILAEVLARHVFSLYGTASFSIMRAGMEATVNRFHSAIKEDLIVSKKPAKGKALGLYKVKRKKGEVRPYKILLSGNKGLEGSCSCEDYQHNTLRWCKHLAAVYLYWHRGPNVRRRFLREIAKTSSYLRWYPPVKVKGTPSPLEGLEMRKLRKHSNSKLLAQLYSYFDNEGKLNLNRVEQLKDKVKFFGLLKKCFRYFKEDSLRIDPSIPPLIERQLEELQWPQIYQNNKKDLLRSINSLNFELYPYQREGVKKALRAGRFLIADEMGLGKTIQGIAFAEALLKEGYVNKALLICPAALKAQWKREWGLVSGREATVVSGSADVRKRIYQESNELLIINYELLLRDLDEIQSLDFDLVILDEAQRIKNFETETAKRVKTLKPFFRLILTGTPMENRISELSSLLDWIRPAALGPYWRLNPELTYYNPENPEERG